MKVFLMALLAVSTVGQPHYLCAEEMDIEASGNLLTKSQLTKLDGYIDSGSLLLGSDDLKDKALPCFDCNPVDTGIQELKPETRIPLGGIAIDSSGLTGHLHW